jgi:hypothetical protein
MLIYEWIMFFVRKYRPTKQIKLHLQEAVEVSETNQAKMRKSEKTVINLLFKKILLKECLPPVKTPPLSVAPLLSPIENPPNKRQEPTDNMSDVMTTRNIMLLCLSFHPKPLAYFPPQTTNPCYHHSPC